MTHHSRYGFKQHFVDVGSIMIYSHLNYIQHVFSKVFHLQLAVSLVLCDKDENLLLDLLLFENKAINCDSNRRM